MYGINTDWFSFVCVLNVSFIEIKEADYLARKAESRHDFSLLTKSNAFRRKVTEKAQESKGLQIEIDQLKEKLKS